MRFSLMTLLLLTLFSGSLLLIWRKRGPAWVLAERRPIGTYSAVGLPRSRFSPDQTRKLDYSAMDDAGSETWVCDEKSGQKLAYLYSDANGWTHYEAGYFESDDCVIHVVHLDMDFTTVTQIPGSVYVYRRRFPEWWWGHFYRPEVWISVGLGIVMIVRSAQALRRKAA